MEILKKQSAAIAVMILMILAATLFGGHSSLAKLRGEAERVFAAGIDGDGIGIQNDLEERSAAAYNLVNIARKYLPETDASIQGVLTARDALSAAGSISDKYEADQALSDAVTDLKNKLDDVNLSEKDAPYPDRLYTNFLSRGETISHDPYNRLAAEFNAALTEFPASLLSKLTGVKSLELFR